jgi:hypothetical protein
MRLTICRVATDRAFHRHSISPPWSTSPEMILSQERGPRRGTLRQCAVGPLPHPPPQRGVDAHNSAPDAVRPLQLLDRRDVALSVSPRSGGGLCRPSCAPALVVE